MAIEKEQWNSLASYLSGQSTESERAIVENWIASSDENKAIFTEAKKIWDKGGIHLTYPEVNATQFLSEIRSNINRESKNVKLRSLITWPLRVAAAITIVIVSYFVFRSNEKENIIINSGNQVVTLYLPDSTKVWLNINSQLVYEKDFHVRNVALSGEAFLSVRKDTNAFTVTTKNTITQVVGTVFNLKEQGDSTVTLTVAEGVVNFSEAGDPDKDHVVVKAHEKAIANKKSGLTKSRNDDSSFAKWREHNNPQFEEEKNNAAQFLSNTYAWRKNQINQSVIEGTLTNKASLAAYHKIILNVTYTKPGGDRVNVELMINETVGPGKKLHYKKRLLDLFTDTQSVHVTIKSANATTNPVF